MAVPPAAGALSARTDQPPSAAPLRLALLVVLVVLLLVAAGALVWLLADRRGQADDLQSERDAVITPKFATDFETSGLPIAEQTVKQAGYARTAQVFGVGVQALDSDSAVALVAAGLKGSYADPKRPSSGKRVDAGEDVLRWEVDLVKTGGKWLVDDYSPVTGAGASQ